MKLKRQRVHESGSSNLDFRSKRDNNSISLYQPWKEGKKYGTMGYSKLKLSVDNLKNFKLLNKDIITTKEINFESPDPKVYSSAKFYQSQNIPIKKRTYFESEKIAELDESFIGKETYLGDSMMISANAKIKRTKTTLIDSINRGMYYIILAINKNNNFDKIKTYKNVDLDSKSEIFNANTDKNKINKDKIRNIRIALRKRYSNRTNYIKIFKDWDFSKNGIINLKDAHLMINNLGIPVDYNETRALISTSNKNNNDILDLECFMDLIFSESQAINLDKFEGRYL